LPGEASVDCNAVVSPAWEAGYYARLLPQLVESWRAVFDVEFTALIVQLHSYGDADDTPAARSGSHLPALRDTQLSVLALSAGGVAVAIDIGDRGSVPIEYPTCGWTTGIHPRNKTEVGRRLALRLAVIEGWAPEGAADGPTPAGWAANTTGVTISMDAATTSGLALLGTADCSLAVPAGKPCCQSAGVAASFPYELRLADGATFTLANAAVDAAAGTVTLTPVNATVQGPFTGVRYAWQAFPTCSLSNAGSLPATPFFKAL
jgi:hypothetical protein